MTSRIDVETTAMSIEDAGHTLLDPSAYADGRVERACAILRSESPVHRVESPGFRPFFAVTRHDDISHVERQRDLFHAAPRYRLFRAADEPREGVGLRGLVRMDPPEHSEHRALVAGWFQPRQLRNLENHVRALATSAVDAMARRVDTYDFVTEISMHFPLSVICSMLGIPESDRGLILGLTQQSFGSEDPEYQSRVLGSRSPDTAVQFVEYFSGVVAERRANPTDDISSVLAHAVLHDEPLPARDLFGYFGILATAGHDTTSSTIAGGLLALIENPDQLQRLRGDNALVPSAAEEMFRWTTPVKSFMRTAMADVEIRGQRIAEGEAVLLLYPSANWDENIFDEPDHFDVGRNPNNHLAFGHGAHFCLGAPLARMETRAFFAELIPRLRHIELAAPPELVKTLFVGGLKHLQIRASVI